MPYQNGQGPSDQNSKKRPPSAPVFNSPRVVNWLIGIMVVFHIGFLILPKNLSYTLQAHLSFIPVALSYGFPGSIPGVLISAITYQFLHADFMHLLFNSAWLLIFGTIVARRLELVSFIVFFLLCGVLGAGVHLILFPNSVVPVVGASGAVSGLMGAAGRFAIFPPQGGWQLSLHGGSGSVVPLSDRRLQAFAGIWIVINLVFGIGSFSGGEGQLVAWDIHIGGLIAGLLLFPRFDRWRRPPASGDNGKRKKVPYLRRVK
jgi:membrane associated rhomboid family serine protease